jgi:copper(I)-binding protein
MLLTVCACSLAQAEAVSVSNPWTRATVPGQKGAGVFMTLSSAAGSRLVSVSSPVAALGQVHEMHMDGDIMRMQERKSSLDLPAGKTVELKPGGMHIMLLDLKAPLARDSTIALTLVFADARGVQSSTELTVPVKALSPVSSASAVAPLAHAGHGQAVQP